MRYWLLLLVPLVACGDDDGMADASVDMDGGSDAAVDPDGGPDAMMTSDAGMDAAMPPPLMTSACDSDGTCDPGETCASCAADCGSCDVAELASQRDKFVDETCAEMGDGLTDECASSAGGAGRFNELQAALDSLEAGDTLHVYPGDYWRDVTGRDSGGIYTMGNSGTADRPIVITARFRDDRPTIHSCDPAEPTRCPMPALAVYGDHAIADHLVVRGRLQVWGATESTIQYVDCTHGWGACGDGNWSCLRIESCTDCTAHHNWVHDISGAGMGEACPPGETTDFPDRGAGLKEFQSVGTIWEFNTVTRAPRWAYDLHRNSVNTTLRFNDFPAFPQAIHVDRSQNLFIYGNVMVARDEGGGSCIDIAGRNERVEAEPHIADVHHNTCIGPQTGISVGGGITAQIHDNIVDGLRRVNEDPRNVVVEVGESTLSNNAYSSAGNYRRQTYEPDTWSEDLTAWQADNGWDEESMEVECTFANPPTGDGAPYDVHVSGTCATLARDGGEVGAYGITNCVGHTCP